MDDLRAQAERLGITVDKRWSEDTLRDKIAQAKANDPRHAPQDELAPVKMFPVRLLRNYRPRSDQFRVIEAGEAPFDGLVQPNKLWAGTLVELPTDEALALIQHEEVEKLQRIDDQGRLMTDDKGRKMTFGRTKRTPLAERADALPAV